MQRLSIHMRQVLALPVVIEDGSKVGRRIFCVCAAHLVAGVTAGNSAVV